MTIHNRSSPEITINEEEIFFFISQLWSRKLAETWRRFWHIFAVTYDTYSILAVKERKHEEHTLKIEVLSLKNYWHTLQTTFCPTLGFKKILISVATWTLWLLFFNLQESAFLMERNEVRLFQSTERVELFFKAHREPKPDVYNSYFIVWLLPLFAARTMSSR